MTRRNLAFASGVVLIILSSAGLLLVAAGLLAAFLGAWDVDLWRRANLAGGHIRPFDALIGCAVLAGFVLAGGARMVHDARRCPTERLPALDALLRTERADGS